ncbi:MAG: hypothetical protein HY284_05690, partial [Nitrospirae bacterium]|nr:hypothetical protein [Nitrospirota bacterium]
MGSCPTPLHPQSSRQRLVSAYDFISFFLLAVSAFYYSILEPPVPIEAKIYPVLLAVGMIIAEGWVLRRRANKKKEMK